MARQGFGVNKGSASVQTAAGINVAASSPRRAKLFDFWLGSGASPADNALIWIIQRSTTAPTGTTVTPNMLDPADTLASTIVVTGTVTADGTLTSGAFLDRIPLNQRGTVRWVSAPNSELVLPATANNGVILGLSAASTTTLDVGGKIEEY